MAYTPTRQQRSGVTTTGTVQATGMQRLANAFNKISERVDRERALDRQQLFDMAVIQAQADGKSSVKFDENNRLVPLTDTAYEPGMFYKADEAKVKQVFEKFMTQTYTTAFNTDVSIAASKALSDNPHNPDAIVAVAEEYEKNINSLPENLQNAVRPAFMRAFAQSEISARSALNKIVNEQTIATGLDRISQIEQNLSTHYFSAGVSGENVDQDIIKMDMKEIEDIRENLKMIMPETKLNQIIDNMYTNVQGQLFNGRIEKVFNEKGHTDSLREIILLGKELRKTADSGINVDRIVDEGKKYLAGLQAVEVARKAAERELSSENSGILNLAIENNEIPTLTALQNRPEWESINESEKAILQRILKSKNKMAKTDEKADLINDLQEKISKVYADMSKVYNVDGLPDMARVSQLEAMAGLLRKKASENGVFSNIQVKYSQVLTLAQNAMKAHIKENNDIALDIVLKEMQNREYEHPPTWYKDPDFVNTLFDGRDTIQITLGSADSNVMTRVQWSNFVDQHYTKDWLAYNDDMVFLNKAVNQIRNAYLEPGTKLYNIFNKYNVQKSITWTNSKGEQLTTAVDVLARNEEQATASLVHAVKWTAVLKQLHPELIRVFKNFETVKNEQAYYKISAHWQTLQKVLNEQSNPQDAQLMMGELMGLHDINYEWMQRASLLDFEEFKLVMAGQRSAESEKLKITLKEGETVRDLIDNVFEKQFTEKGIAAKLAGFIGINLDKDKDPNKQAVYKQMMNTANNMTEYSMFSLKPMIDFATITHLDFVADSDLMKIIENGVLGRIARGNYNDGSSSQDIVEAALGDTLLALGKANLGLVIQGDGRVYLEKHPYMKTAKNSIPPDKTNASFTELDVLADVNNRLSFMLPKDQRFIDTTDKYGRPIKRERSFITKRTDRFGREIKSYQGVAEGILTQIGDVGLPKIIKANMPFDGTYTVYGVRPDSTLVALLPSYTPDWSTSFANEAYKKAYDDWKEGSWNQTAWAVIPFMDQVQLKLMIDDYKTSASVPNTIEKLTKLVNKARYGAYFLAGEKNRYRPIEINVNDITEVEKFMNSISRLGIY